MSNNFKLNYTKAVVICHGLSEIIFTQNLKSNLKAKIEIESRRNGSNSIQLTSLISFLKSSGFKSINSIIRKYSFSIEHSHNEIKNFKIFIIMDIDEKELTSKMIESYKNKSMFDEFDYKDLIVPIYNDKNLDDVLIELGYKINKKAKGESYRKIFPGNNGDYNSFITIKEKFKKTNNSNMILLLEYLESLIVHN